MMTRKERFVTAVRGKQPDRGASGGQPLKHKIRVRGLVRPRGTARRAMLLDGPLAAHLFCKYGSLTQQQVAEAVGTGAAVSIHFKEPSRNARPRPSPPG